MMVDGEDAEANVIAVISRCLFSSILAPAFKERPRLAVSRARERTRPLIFLVR